MKDSFRQSMAWLHTWAGLLAGWVLYFMFITGTAGYLDTEIDRWMRPELPVAHYPLPPHPALGHAETYLQMHAADARRWTISLPISRNDPYLQVSWQAAAPGGRGLRTSAYLDPASGQVLDARETAGGQTLYQMHWKLHYLPSLASEWIVAIATSLLLLALVTGIVVHRKIFADFFTFRPGKGQRSWLDAHNLAGVVSLPFQLMITYSGLVFLMFSYMPLVISAWYGPGERNLRSFYDDMFPPLAQARAAQRSAPLVSLQTVVRDAQARWGQPPVATLDIQHPNDAHARIIVVGDFAAGPVRTADILVYDGASGDLLMERKSGQSAARDFRDLMLGLHEGIFAAPVLRALYVLSGLLGAAMIATGLVLWSRKRRERVERGRAAAHIGLRAVERLNVAVVIGLPLAIAGYFWANRLLPVAMAQRAEMEVHVLFLVWLATFAHAALRKHAWQEQTGVAALAFGLIPILNAMTSERHLARALPAGDWVMAGFDLASLALGVAFFCMWRRLRRGPAS